MGLCFSVNSGQVSGSAESLVIWCRITSDLADLALRKSDLARCKCYRITPFECRITPRGVIWHSLGSDLALPGEWFGTMCNELGILPNHCDLAIPREWFGNIWSDLATKNLTESLILEWFGMPNHSFWSDLAFFNAESHNHSVIWQGGGSDLSTLCCKFASKHPKALRPSLHVDCNLGVCKT